MFASSSHCSGESILDSIAAQAFLVLATVTTLYLVVRFGMLTAAGAGIAGLLALLLYVNWNIAGLVPALTFLLFGAFGVSGPAETEAGNVVETPDR